MPKSCRSRSRCFSDLGKSASPPAEASVSAQGSKHYHYCRSSLQRSQTNTANDAHAPDTASTSSTDSIGASMANRFQALQSSTASGSVASETEAAASPSEGSSDDDADMAFARKLQEEEDRIHYERMLQMAGIGTASHFWWLLPKPQPSLVFPEENWCLPGCQYCYKLCYPVTISVSKLWCIASNTCVRWVYDHNVLHVTQTSLVLLKLYYLASCLTDVELKCF